MENNILNKIYDIWNNQKIEHINKMEWCKVYYRHKEDRFITFETSKGTYYTFNTKFLVYNALENIKNLRDFEII